MDINETAAAGIDLAALIAAADAADPLQAVDEGAAVQLAEAGVGVLRAALDEASTRSGGDKLEPVAGLLDSDEAMRALGYAWRHRRNQVEAGLTRARALLGRSPVPRQLQEAIDRTSARQAAEIQRRRAELGDGTRSSVVAKMLSEIGDGPPSLKVPSGFDLGWSGVFRDTDPPERISHGALLLLSSRQDVSTGRILVEVAWKRRGAWERHVVPRQTISDTRGIASLADRGAPVNSSNARGVIEYLAALEACNASTLPEVQTCSHMGWQPGLRTFVAGAEVVGEPLELEAVGGLEALAEGYRPGGTWEGWCTAVRDHVARFPRAMLGIYASACTPLLAVLDQPGFVVDWSGETSLGKTTTLRCAASVWGVPDDRGDGVIMSWASSSMVGPMTLAWFLQSLPVILDDTKRGRPQTIGALLYDIPAGQERLKGTAEGGLRQIRRWRSCLLSTGEAPITSFSEAGGTRARVIALRGAPLDSREAAEAITGALLDHYGHLGPRLVEALVRAPSEAIERLRTRFRELREHYAAEASSPVAGRLASYVAVLHLAAEVVHRLGVPPPQECDPIGVAWAAARTGAEDDPPREALRALHAWATASASRFDDGGPRKRDAEPHGGWLGQWTSGHLAFFPHALEAQLDAWGYDRAGVIDAWQRRGWLQGAANRRKRKVTLGSGRRVRMYVFEVNGDGAPAAVD
jgi:putative DNA primase/helicase